MKLVMQILDLGPIKSWSYSGLKEFEECAHRSFLSKVEKHEQPPSPALDRGTAIHTMAEDYVQGTIDDLPQELANHRQDFDELRDLYKQGVVEIEQDWAVDQQWQSTGWYDDDCWGRIKLDAFVLESPTSARVIDHKTGKKYPIAHGSQGQIYSIAAFMRHPALEFIQTEFWYLDQKEDNKLVKNYTRDQALVFLPRLNQRAIALTTATDFPPKPSKYNCKWCPHRSKEEGGNGACTWSEV